MLKDNLTISRITIALICSSAIILGGCASHKPKAEARVWDDKVVIADPVTPLPPPPPPPPIARSFDHTTEFAGCTGNFAVTDMSGKTIQTGRAFNAPEGLYILDKMGNKTGNIIVASTGMNILFKPDCNCGANQNQMPQSEPNGMHHMHPNCGNQ